MCNCSWPATVQHQQPMWRCRRRRRLPRRCRPVGDTQSPAHHFRTPAQPAIAGWAAAQPVAEGQTALAHPAPAAAPVAENQPCYQGANFTAGDCPGGSCWASQPNGCGSSSQSIISSEIVPDKWPGGAARALARLLRGRRRPLEGRQRELAPPALLCVLAPSPTRPPGFVCRCGLFASVHFARLLLPHGGRRQGGLRPGVLRRPAGRVPAVAGVSLLAQLRRPPLHRLAQPR